MHVKLAPIAHGNHDNIHFNFYVGSKKNRVIKAKFVAFSDTGKAYLSHFSSNIPLEFIDIDHLFKTMYEKFATKEYKLQDLSIQLLSERRRAFTTQQLLTLYK